MDTREHRTGNLSVMFVKSQATIRDSDGGGEWELRHEHVFAAVLSDMWRIIAVIPKLV